MHTFKKTLVAAALISAGAAAQAEVSGSIAIASSYLWRGQDLSPGSGTAVVSGSVDYAHDSGIYAGVWGSSGDDNYGMEYDLYAGWGGEVFDGFSVDLGYVAYIYPEDTSGSDFEEAILGLSYGAFGFTFVEPTTTGATYNYYALSAGFGDFSFAYGMWEDSGADYSHFDATYSMGDLAFTASIINDDGFGVREEPQFVVSYSIPLD
ncbi:MAG: TorF family putative porin [Imperialibacter sp.]